MTYEDFAYEGTKTRRREERRDIRTILGTSSDAAPNVHQALRAAEHLSQLLSLATGGAYRLTITDKRGDSLDPWPTLGRVRVNYENNIYTLPSLGA